MYFGKKLLFLTKNKMVLIDENKSILSILELNIFMSLKYILHDMKYAVHQFFL